jgi:hypothetical protein
VGQKLRRKAAADYLGRSEHWLKDAQLSGAIPFYRIGRVPVFDTDDLDRFLAANRVEASDGPLAAPPEPKLAGRSRRKASVG